MAGLILNVLLGLGLVTVGLLLLNESPVTASLLQNIQDLANSVAGQSYHVPFYVAGCVFLLAGCVALFIAFMLFAQTHGFWIV